MRLRKRLPIQKILVVTLSNLGDAVLTLPVFSLLKETYPKAQLDVVVGSASAMVFQGDERIQKILIYDKKISFQEKLKFLGAIRGEKYDLIIDLRRSFFGLLGGARYHNSYFTPLPGSRSHRVLRHLYALRGILPLHHAKSFLLGQNLLEASSLYSFVREVDEAGRRLVVVAPGSKSDLKKWPIEYYAQLLDRLTLEERCQIVLVGAPAELEDAQKLLGLMRSKPENLVGKTSWTELVALMKRADLVITNDSAPLHIADSLRRPVLAIFGPTDPRKYGPRYRHSVVASRLLFCSPCEKAQCRYQHECMTELGVEEVYAKAKNILNDAIDIRNIKILVVRLDRIGDVTLSLPAIQAIRDRFPNASISVVTRPATAALVEGHPAVDNVLPYRYERKGRHSGVLGSFRFIYEVIRQKFDVVFILNPSLRSYLVPFFAGIPYRVGFKTKYPGLLTHAIEDRRHEGARHEAEYTLDVVRAFGVDADRADSYEGTLGHFRVQKDPAKSKKIIALHAGASCPSKRWPVENFAALGQKILAADPEVTLAVIGGKEEKEMGQRLTGLLGSRAQDLTDQFSLKELAGFLSQCELLISNDSGPVHVAAAVGTRTLTIFGRSLPGLGITRWRALGRGHTVLQKDVGCAVCLAHHCPIEFECLKALSVEEVWEKFVSMFSVQRIA